MDMQALSNKYGMPITIISVNDFNDPYPKVERMEPDGDFVVKEKIEEMILLNTGKVHFDLIMKKNESDKLDNIHSDTFIPKEKNDGTYISDVEEEFTLKDQVQPNVTEIEQLRCELAESKKEIKSLKELVNNMLPKETDKVKDNICVECGKLFSKFIYLETHMRKEHPERETFECTSCRKQYSTKENLRYHIAEEHTKKFNCDSCKKSFKSEQELKLHDEKDHTTNYDCNECDHQNTSEILLNKHIQLKHSSDLRECKGLGSQKCGENFNSYNDLMDHRRDQHNSGNKICRYFRDGTCYFLNEEKGKCWYLHRHDKISSNENYNEFECESCNQIFKTKSEVMSHRKDKHEEEVPLCNDYKQGKVCSRRRYWFSHRKNFSAPIVIPTVNSTSKITTTNSSNDQDFRPPLATSRPPDQINQMMKMIATIMTEINHLKENFQQINRD